MNRWLRVVLEALLFAIVASLFLALALLVLIPLAQDSGALPEKRK